MTLDNWAANHSSLLPSSRAALEDVALGDDVCVSMLDLRWNPRLDLFQYKVHLPLTTANVTKRSILSETARLYDPLGWLAPVLIRAKILLQHLWLTGSDWDAPVPDALQNEWMNLRTQLTQLPSLHIPRWFGTSSSTVCRLVGFCDASEKAYSAVVYLVVESAATARCSILISAKSKVAPLKTLSLPRLELCGALLLANLLQRVRSDLEMSSADLICFSDSQVVLAWLRKPPCTWATFVANRTSQIRSLLPTTHWHHVRSAYNPADLATRGVSVQQLLEAKLWWHGPSWLLSDAWDNSTDQEFSTALEQRKSLCVMSTLVNSEDIESVLSRFSSMPRLCRSLSYIFRWRAFAQHPKPPAGQPLSAQELSQTRQRVIREVQRHSFPAEVSALYRHHTLPRHSKLCRLQPFLCEEGLLRVGGRLQRAHLAFSERHPIIIPHGSHLARLLVQPLLHLLQPP